MNYIDVIAAWNANNESSRLWGEITDRERIEFALSLAGKVEKQELVAYRVETGYEQPFYWYSDTLPTRGKWDALYTDPQPCPECEKLKAGAGEWKETLHQVLTDTAKELGCQADNEEILETIAKLKAELERERMRLAACGVVAMANTEESAVQARQMHPDYESASCSDVARAVDSEMQLRKERDDLAAQVTHWKANHASVVEQARILKERPDMPIERVKAYENWVAMAAQIEKMRKALDVAKDLATVVINHPDFDNDNPIEPRPFVALIQRFEAQFDEALAPPDLSTGILNRVRAEAINHCIQICKAHTSTKACAEIMAADMDAGK